MNESDIPRLDLTIRQHFSKATEGDTQLIFEDCKGFPLDKVEWALAAHHRERGHQAYRPSSARILEILRGKQQGGDPGTQRVVYRRIIDFIRSESARKQKYATMTDFAVLSDHFSWSWEETKAKATSAYGTNWVRNLIRSHAKHAFLELGMSEPEAIEWSSAVVELNSDEKLSARPISEVIGSEYVSRPLQGIPDAAPETNGDAFSGIDPTPNTPEPIPTP